MHVIVGQGQLDKVLHATPEDRRGFIEEAAGILKHRRRKEKTVRKLEAMQANLSRLSDLTGEIRRQLTPLGKQAEVARRAQSVQFEVRDARSRLLADDLVALQSALAQDVADESALKARRAVVERDLEAGRQRQAVLEGLAAEATPALNAARENWYSLSTGRERLRSLGSLAEERRRLLGAADVVPDPAGTRTSWSSRPPASATSRPGWNGRSWTAPRPWTPRQPPNTTPNRPPPPRTSGSRPCSGPPRTGVKAWPSSPGRSARHGPVSSLPSPSSAVSANRKRPARSAAARRTASSRPWKRRSQGSRTARNRSTPITRPRARPSKPSSPKLTP